jgi:tetratricopeptide (TPR) repeat protein
MPRKIRGTLRLAAVLAAATASAAGQPAPQPTPRPAMLLPGMGFHHHPIATSSAEAQKFFDQGLTLAYGFNHEEAVRSFSRAAQLDPKAAMPHWGIALALGSNINDPEPDAERLKKARAAVEDALRLSAGGPEIERAYVEALAERYPTRPGPEAKERKAEYHAAMRALSERYSDDLDAATLYAESGMVLNPWRYWRADGSPEEGTLEIVGVLESVVKRDPMHPGANHYYVHMIEASPHPERGLPEAARLETLVPGIGHLIHMPAHIYMRTGDYAAAVRSNERAAEADRDYIRLTGAQGLYAVGYYNHDVHFLSAAAAMAGRYGESKKAADQLFAGILPVVADWPMLEAWLAQPLLVELRFGKWSEIWETPDPGPRLPELRAMRLYARGVTAARTGNVAKAEAERQAFARVSGAVGPHTMFGMNNMAEGIFVIAGHVLDARIAEAKGDSESAIRSWRDAVAAQDALVYDEPPPWDYPVRESLGGTLLRTGRPAEAEVVFREDLEQNPGNGRSLFGLWKSLEAQQKAEDAAWVRVRYETAWKGADADVSLRIEDL